MNYRKLLHSDFILVALGAVAAVVSTVGLGGYLFTSLKLPQLGASTLSIGVAVLAGLLSNFLVSALGRLPHARRVFISYPKELSIEAQEAAVAFRKAGAKVWIDTERIKPGMEITSTINAGIRESDAFVLLLDKFPTEFVRTELDLARKMGVKIVPVISGDIQPYELPVDLANIQYVDLRKNRSEGLRQLVQAVV